MKLTVDPVYFKQLHLLSKSKGSLGKKPFTTTDEINTVAY
jgi:hypothetical protein